MHLDLAAFLAGEESPEVRGFRDHYPTCPACSAEVRAWMEVHAGLNPPLAENQHPTEELLLQFESQPDRMSGVARTSVETHLKTCASCRDELHSLRSFDFSILDRPVADRLASTRQVPAKLAWLKSFLAPLRAVLVHPAFAYGLVLLLLLPQLSSLSPELSRYGPGTEPKTVQERPIAAAPPQSEGAIEAERIESERRDETAVGRMADEKMPRRMREMPAEADAIRAGRPSSPPAPRGAVRSFSGSGGGYVARKKEGLSQEETDRLGKKDADASLQQRGYREDSTGNEIGDAGAPPAKQLTIQMDPSGQNNIPMQGMLGGATLHIKPQQPITLGSDVAIRIKSADGRRELREIHTASRQDGSLELKIPPGWMPDGPYSLEVWPLDALPRKSRQRHDH